MSTTDVLWGGQLKAVGFDPVVHVLTLEVDVVEGGARKSYELACSGVVDLRFTNSIPEPWSYAEVTEVHAAQTSAGKWRVEVVLWSERCELVCTCDSFMVTHHS